mmetsp:Transcript_4647/g.10930  ORF Transcript_4647/g.10930 Transcript_4647/m.10930 type:complete len:663 (+) Transcript_4647:217-2205(+)|eukprot:CAMPEP_0114503744 /NCGR_PEP_ID=MMETSP0109-20121206/9818_1 /TAXON_ID=29199 /ORGANISM="Chlorarachnion reptans, Strain CCCM449" /LENGTH=662 /DNA_ID=CAMNT_0001681807 /DNA_START=415 /DNA_END=2403 /DNA_ORIENTATION=+
MERTRGSARRRSDGARGERGNNQSLKMRKLKHEALLLALVSSTLLLLRGEQGNGESNGASRSELVYRRQTSSQKEGPLSGPLSWKNVSLTSSQRRSGRSLLKWALPPDFIRMSSRRLRGGVLGDSSEDIIDKASGGVPNKAQKKKGAAWMEEAERLQNADGAAFVDEYGNPIEEESQLFGVMDKPERETLDFFDGIPRYTREEYEQNKERIEKEDSKEDKDDCEEGGGGKQKDEEETEEGSFVPDLKPGMTEKEMDEVIEGLSPKQLSRLADKYVLSEIEKLRAPETPIAEDGEHERRDAKDDLIPENDGDMVELKDVDQGEEEKEELAIDDMNVDQTDLKEAAALIRSQQQYQEAEGRVDPIENVGGEDAKDDVDEEFDWEEFYRLGEDEKGGNRTDNEAEEQKTEMEVDNRTDENVKSVNLTDINAADTDERELEEIQRKYSNLIEYIEASSDDDKFFGGIKEGGIGLEDAGEELAEHEDMELERKAIKEGSYVPESVKNVTEWVEDDDFVDEYEEEQKRKEFFKQLEPDPLRVPADFTGWDNYSCRDCGTKKDVIRKGYLGICRKCFRYNAEQLEFEEGWDPLVWCEIPLEGEPDIWPPPKQKDLMVSYAEHDRKLIAEYKGKKYDSEKPVPISLGEQWKFSEDDERIVDGDPKEIMGI